MDQSVRLDELTTLPPSTASYTACIFRLEGLFIPEGKRLETTLPRPGTCLMSWTEASLPWVALNERSQVLISLLSVETSSGMFGVGCHQQDALCHSHASLHGHEQP